MSRVQLNDIKGQLQIGDRYKLAVMLKVNPAKITLALDGLVRSAEFMDKLRKAAARLIESREQIA